MPRTATASNVTVFVDRLYDFKFANGMVVWCSDENGETGRKCMPIAGFRKSFTRMEKLLAGVGKCGNVVSLVKGA